MNSIVQRAGNWYKRNAAIPFSRNRLNVRPSVPVISFSFDDFPSTALHVAGEALKEDGFRGTYFVSLGLLGKDSPSGPICTADDVIRAHAEGHELGSHTYSHCHSWNTDGRTFEASLKQNQSALEELIPGAVFRSFAYPISLPNPGAKAACARTYECSRGGGQKLNVGPTDLNQMSAFFLEKTADDVDPVKKIIDENVAACGWLILATHDVTERPSQYGCSPQIFKTVVKYAAKSGARIMTVSDALDFVRGVAA